MQDSPKEPDRRTDPRPAPAGSSDASDDTSKHPYYYDDAHGYETYDPEKDDDAEDDAASETEGI